MGTSAGRIHAQIEALEERLTNTALGYWCRLRKMLEADEVAVDDDDHNRGVRCELVRCGLIQLVKEGIVCPLLDRLRTLRQGWKRRKERARNIRQAEAAQMLLPFEGELRRDDVKSQGGTSPNQQQRRSQQQTRKPRQRGLLRRIRKWEQQRRDTVKAATPSHTLPVEREIPSSCARRELRVPKAEQATPEEAAFISAHCLDDEDKTILNLREVVAAIGWQRAAEMTEEGRSKGAWKPIGWVKGKLAKQAQWGIQPNGQRPPRPKHTSDRERRRLEKVAWVMERQRAEDAAKAEMSA